MNHLISLGNRISLIRFVIVNFSQQKTNFIVMQQSMNDIT
jgi:hypothetical protein